MQNFAVVLAAPERSEGGRTVPLVISLTFSYRPSLVLVMIGMTLDQEIALWASVGSCASAIATFWTVRQIKQQRADSYRPDLVLGKTFFEARAPSDSKVTYHWTLPSEKKEAKGAKGDDEGSNAYVLLYNLGIGPARNVLVKWAFPVEETARQLSALAAKRGWSGAITFEGGSLDVEIDSTTECMSPWDENNVELFDFILPASLAKEPQYIRLPDEYTILFSVHRYLTVQLKPAKGADQAQVPDFPKLTANFEYQDIGGANHKVAFDLKASFTPFMLKNGGQVGEIASTRRPTLIAEFRNQLGSRLLAFMKRNK